MKCALVIVSLALAGCASLQGDGYYGCTRSDRCPSSAPICGTDHLCHAAGVVVDGGLTPDTGVAPLTYPPCDGTVAGTCGADTCYYDPTLGATSNGYCTRHCSSDAECPAFGGATSACVGGQCARGCMGVADCADGLACTGGRWVDGAQLRLCVSLVAAEANWYDQCQRDADCVRPLSCVNGFCLRSCQSVGDCVTFLEICQDSAIASTRGCTYQCDGAADCNTLDGQCVNGGCHPDPSW